MSTQPMKLRIVVRETYCEAAANVAGAQAEIEYLTFEVDAPEAFAKYWRSNKSDLSFRSIIGVEVQAYSALVNEERTAA